jgi:hypothetical protein
MQTVNCTCCDIRVYEYQNVFSESIEPKLSADAAERITEGIFEFKRTVERVAEWGGQCACSLLRNLY